MSKDALALAIARGEYVIDTHAVAEAILRRSLSEVLVAPQPLDWAALGVEQDDAAPDADVA